MHDIVYGPLLHVVCDGMQRWNAQKKSNNIGRLEQLFVILRLNQSNCHIKYA